MSGGGSRIDLKRLEPRRVCLIKPSALGDVIHALPVLASLKQRWPEARLAWVVNRGLAGLIEGHPDLDEVLTFDRSRVGIGPRGLRVFGGFLRELRRRRFDLAIDLQGLLRSGLMTWATGAPTRVGLASAREGATAAYTHRIATDRRHAVDRLLAVAGALGAETSEPRFELPPPASEVRDWAARTLAPLPRPWVLLNPGARWVTKRWPALSFAEVGRRAAERFGAGLAILGAAEDRPHAEAIRTALEPAGIRPLDLTGRTTLPQLAALAGLADLVVSNDTGPLHLAVAAGAPVVAVFTCTDPSKTGPYGPNASVVRSGIWCAASCLKRCPRMECMGELGPERVWAVVAERLATAGVVSGDRGELRLSG